MANRHWADRYLGNPNIQGLLGAIRYAEGTEGDAGFRTQFTGTKFDVSNGWAHPRQIRSSNGLSSDASGAGQFLSTTWDSIAQQEGLTDFSPQNQLRGMLALVKRRGVDLDQVAQAGVNPAVFDKLAPEWASLPTLKTGTSYYGQGGKNYGELEKAFQRYRGAPGGVPQAGGAPAGTGKRSPAAGGSATGGATGGGDTGGAGGEAGSDYQSQVVKALLDTAPLQIQAPRPLDAAAMASPIAITPVASGLAAAPELLQPLMTQPVSSVDEMTTRRPMRFAGDALLGLGNPLIRALGLA